MANLRDKKTGTILENVAENEVNDMVMSGRYGFLAGFDEKVFLKGSRGEPFVSRGDLAESYVRDGTFTYATPLEVEKFKSNEQFANSTLGGMSAAAMGIDDWLFAGLGTHAAEAAGIIDEGLPDAVESSNPWLWNVLGLPAAGVAAFFSAGGTTGARAAVGAGTAAAKSTLLREAAEGVVKRGYNSSGNILSNYTLPGISQKIAEKVTEGSTKAYMRLGDKYVPRVIQDIQLAKNFGPHAAKIMGATTGALVEGGLWGAGEGISESLVGEPGESAEHILSSMGTNALMGAAFGGVISSILPILVGSKGVMATLADKFMDKAGDAGGWALNRARETIVQVATETHKLSPQHARALAQILVPGDPGAQVYTQLRDMVENIDKYAKTVSLQIDSQLLADDILQIADQNGFSLDWIERSIRDTRKGTKPSDTDDPFEVQYNPKVVKLQEELDEIDRRIKGTSTAEDYADVEASRIDASAARDAKDRTDLLGAINEWKRITKLKRLLSKKKIDIPTEAEFLKEIAGQDYYQVQRTVNRMLQEQLSRSKHLASAESLAEKSKDTMMPEDQMLEILYGNFATNQARLKTYFKVLSSEKLKKPRPIAFGPSKLEADTPEVVYTSDIKSAVSSRRVAARTDRAGNQILIDKNEVLRTFEAKVWTVPKVKGVNAFPKNAFETVDEWELFLIEHERAHFSPENMKLPKGAVRENDANRIAYDAVKESRKRVGTAKKNMRLYRAEPAPGAEGKPPPDWLKERPDYKGTMRATGRWFTNDLDEALWYLKNEYPDGRIVYVDVPIDVAERHNVSKIKKVAGEDPKKFSRRPEIEFFLPEEIAAQKKLFDENDPLSKALKKRESLREKLESTKSELRETVIAYDNEGMAIPSNPMEVLDNVQEPFARFRAEIREISQKFPSLNAKARGELRGQMTQMIHDINMEELHLYRSLFDEEIGRNLDDAHREVAKSKLREFRENLKSKRGAQRLNKWVDYFQDILDNETSYKRIEALFEKGLAKKRKDGALLAHFGESLREAIQTTAETADPIQLMKLADDYGVKISTVLRGSGTSDPKVIRDLIQAMDSIDTSPSAHMSTKEKVVYMRNHVDELIRHAESGKISEEDLLGKWDDPSTTTAMGVRKPLVDSYMDIKTAVKRTEEEVQALRGEMVSVADYDAMTEYMSRREVIHQTVEELGLHGFFNEKLIARSWKAMETAQTNAMNALKYGYVGKDEGVQAWVKNQAIENLRRAMKDKGKWGRLATHKNRFDTLRMHFEELRGQVLSRFTKGVGLDQLADPEAIISYLQKLDKHTAHIDNNRLKDYSGSAADLLRIIKNQFEPAGLLDAPDEVQRALSSKLERLKRLGISDAGVFTKEPIRDWGKRMDDLQNFIIQNDEEMGTSLSEIGELMPIAKALLGDQGRAANMNQGMRDLSRGGVAGAAVYALTGSSQLAMAAGAISGVLGVAQTPRQLVAFINQLRSTRIGSKKAIASYLDDWAANKVPDAAIHKGWEHKSRQAFFITAAAIRRDKAESRAEIRARAAKSRSVDSWMDRIGIALDAEITPENFFEARTALEQLSKSPMLMDRFLEETTKPFSSVPEIQMAMKSLIRGHIQIASRALPKTTSATIFGEEFPPTPHQLSTFQRVLQVLTDPTETILTSMLTGSLTSEMVSTLAEAWPLIYSDIVGKATEMLADPDTMGKLSHSQKQTLSTLIGVSFTNPSELSRLQTPAIPEEEQKRGGRGGGPIASIGERQQVGTSDSILYRAAV